MLIMFFSFQKKYWKDVPVRSGSSILFAILFQEVNEQFTCIHMFYPYFYCQHSPQTVLSYSDIRNLQIQGHQLQDN